jgi:ATP synthase protein I
MVDGGDDVMEQRQPDQQEINGLAAAVGEKAARKLRARRRREENVWFGLGMFGMVGWSVAMPTLALLALGIWVDRRWPSPYSWTLMLLLLGIGLGCLNAWYWVSRQRHQIEAELGELDEDETGVQHE